MIWLVVLLILVAVVLVYEFRVRQPESRNSPAIHSARRGLSTDSRTRTAPVNHSRMGTE